ncbi:roadblock/LC7 domain-containing protein [Streptomyces tubbatahanensis]|uniref:Roadblock/LC7 domain-containing protein n=1 Tax=Streptomyces tubbatahanensis TaxID=2923272 RepID=A0ABY3XLX3_9ACTN|nr:roadblock/LC7 domain-containing protein [Streptomyces tubbatahanensis]UNS95412.1 roadblock/LC7 domain-containing protein [Streptomyces tubbatahanensis]
MAAEPGVSEELYGLLARVPQIGGALAATVDGFVLAEALGPARPAPTGRTAQAAQAEQRPDAEPLAALTAAALGLAFRMNEATGRGAFRELLIHGELGYVATYAAGPSAVLTLLADDRANVGRLHLEGRRTAGRIGEALAASRHSPLPPSASPPASVGGGEPAGARNPPEDEPRRPPLERRRRNPPSPM